MHLISLTSRILFIVSLLAILAACSSVETKTSTSEANPDVARAEQFIQQKDYLSAAKLYRDLAARDTTQTAEYLLRAADASQQGGDFQGAEWLLQTLSTRVLDVNQQLHYQLLQVDLDLNQKRNQQALDTLLAVVLNEQHAPALQERYYFALATAYRQQGDFLQSAQSLQTLDTLLTDPQKRLKVQHEILRNLTALNELTLTDKQPSPPGVAGGWMQLALLVKQHSNDLPALQQAYREWQQSHPEHPALAELFTQYAKQLRDPMQHPSRIAVLLPQTGPYATVAQAIRDGLLISLYNIPATQRPSLQFYDSSDTDAVWSVYQQAVDDKADFIIGPLQKSAVSQLAHAGQLSLPTLALNQVNLDNAPVDNFYMFGLVPEDEARQAAERIWLDGQRQPVALVPDNDWGDRLFNAFSDRWLSLAGHAVDVRRYDPKGNDHSAAITDLLRLNQSKARHQEIQRWLGMRLVFEPNRRTDIDSLFLAARSRQAQSFLPQLKFHRAGGLPVYATSHVWMGKLNKQQLADMRHMRLPDIPMLATNNTRENLVQIIPEITSPLARLYALGMDALALTPHLRRLQSDPYASMDGETGNLSMDSKHRLHRQLVWLQLAKPVKILGYARRLDLPDAAEALPSPVEEALPEIPSHEGGAPVMDQSHQSFIDNLP